MKNLFTFLLLVLLGFSVEAQNLWMQMGQPIEGEVGGAWSSCSVSLSADGKRVAIGTYLKGTGSGNTRIFEFSGSDWLQIGKRIDGECFGDRSGCSVSLSADGSRVAIGASLNGGHDSIAGHTRIFEYSNDSWVQVGADITGEAKCDQSGYSVSLSADGMRVAVGACYNSGNGSNSGHVRVFECSGGDWKQVGGDIDGEVSEDQSGYSVSLSSDGTRVAIGAIFNQGNGKDAGHTRVYGYTKEGWIQIGSDIDGEAPGDWSGCVVSLNTDGSRVAIGAFTNDGNGPNSGHTRIFEHSGNAWVQLGMDIDGEAKGDQSGRAVSLNAKGNTVAIGAYGNDDNGVDSGHVRVFEYIDGRWVQVGDDIDGAFANDMYGWAISVSADGSRVAAGSLHQTNNKKNPDCVRVWTTKKIIDFRGITFKVLSGIAILVSMIIAVFMIKFIFGYIKRRMLRYQEKLRNSKRRSNTVSVRYFQGYGFDEIGITVWPSNRYRYLYEDLESVRVIVHEKARYRLFFNFSGKPAVSFYYHPNKKFEKFAAVLKDIVRAVSGKILLDYRAVLIAEWDKYQDVYENAKNRMDYGMQSPSLDLVKAHWIKLEYKKASKVLDSLLAQSPDNAEALSLKAQITAECGGAQKKVDESLGKALDAEPDNIGLLYTMTLRGIQKKKLDEAKMYLERLQKAAPETPVLYCALGEYLFAKKQFSEACRSMKRSVELEQNELLKNRCAKTYEHYERYTNDRGYRIRYLFRTRFLPMMVVAILWGFIILQLLMFISRVILAVIKRG